MTTILVTGANQGLGLAVVDGAARRLGSQADVYLTGRNPDRVRAAADRLERAGQPVRTAVLDVRDTDAAGRARWRTSWTPTTWARPA